MNNQLALFIFYDLCPTHQAKPSQASLSLAWQRLAKLVIAFVGVAYVGPNDLVQALAGHALVGALL